ncbi:MAG TPA: ribbon-helix-helix protein, CopG family [Candidatus Melainabacteria bacterium]|jgi:uncharacterized protein (DUF1778 family)|nr:ribbon-helix-helix protein, CopG family [Candidatus Melainabacteria bacterium]HIN66552.1 ribbon-helix-helix protein, CopG family [Candidatus Obscuribacterales bacterium]
MVVTTFRTTADLEELLSQAARRTGKARSEIIREAIGVYCRELLKDDKQTWFDELSSSHFQPIRSGKKDLATNPDHLRKAMRDAARRSHPD